MALEAQSGLTQLQNFFDTLYGNQSGYVYIGLKVPKSGEFKQHFFSWPAEKAQILSKIVTETDTKEVYFAPALFDSASSLKIHVKGSNTVWAEFDGKVPTHAELESNNIPVPSIRVRSSSEGHEHWYWLLSEFISVPEIELLNRKITFTLGADVSGWDANQILRPPGTRNHKREESVTLLHSSTDRYVRDFIENIEDVPPVLELPIPTEIPDVAEVIAKVSIPPKLYMLFRNGLPEGFRSEALMALTFGFAELTPMLNNDELLSVLMNADERWGKFKDRPDRLVRLLDIISKVRFKVPYVEQTDIELQHEHNRFQPYGFHSILAVETQLDWVWDGMLHSKGYMLLTGAPGVGKSQFSINFATKACLGEDFLNRNIKEPKRIGFLSLEMGIEEVQYFVDIQSKGFSKEQLNTLDENFLIYPMGEPLYLNEGNEGNRKKVEEIIGDNHLDGVVIDSLGSTTPDELVSEKVRGIMDWNDRLRQKLGCFTWFVHHHRKATGDNKRPNKLSDVYGSVYLTARASSVVCLWEINHSLSMIPLKIRLTKRPDAVSLIRDQYLHHSINESGEITVVTVESGQKYGSKQYTPDKDLPGLQKPNSPFKLS